ncbi:ester cyclase [Salipiger sp.]|uniref:nuclear transport factor 2 family protein n=1 Tax=Salipiger sp. TaxID=2078585 RepID=UPI003A973710
MPFLAGFDARWHDAADYLDALHRDLGEGRRLDLTPDYIASGVICHGGLGTTCGSDAWGAAQAALVAAFPAPSLLPEDAIWTTTSHDALISAQRLLVSARHDGAGLYGAPTGAELTVTAMVDRWCVAGKVREEWLLRDETAILRRIGLPEDEAARIRLAGWHPRAIPEGTRRYTGTGDDDAWGHTLGELVHRVMGGELAVIDRHYDAAAELFYPGGEAQTGPREAESFWIGLRAAFPSAEFRVEHLLGAEESLSSPRAMMRWSLTGRHDGHGSFGAPTGAEVTVLGMTHAEFGPDGLRREWTLIDRPGVLAQILRKTG